MLSEEIFFALHILKLMIVSLKNPHFYTVSIDKRQFLSLKIDSCISATNSDKFAI
jgi:hypothetical protein